MVWTLSIYRIPGRPPLVQGHVPVKWRQLATSESHARPRSASGFAVIARRRPMENVIDLLAEHVCDPERRFQCR